MEFDLRLCGLGDELALSLVAQATILETYAGLADGADLYTYVTGELDARHFHTWLTSDRARIWAVEARTGKCIAGYALIFSDESGEPFKTAELKRLYVLYRFHGSGLGKRLMDAVLEYGRACGTQSLMLRVNTYNERALRFYERYGFERIGEEAFIAGERNYPVFVMRRGVDKSGP
jgi:diamine N-acetyltransferase